MKTIGIKFGEKHSYTDFCLILTDLNISPAVPNTYYIDIPGRNAPLDMSEENGEITYGSRDCKFYFIVDNLSRKDSFEDIKSEISNFLNGRVMDIILDMDSDHYYHGRLTVDDHSQRGNLKQITISAKVEPYKLKTEETVVSVDISGETTVICDNDRMSVVPTVTLDSEMTLVFGEISITANAGTHIFPDIKFTEGENKVTCTGTGNITFTYQEGAL